MPLALSTSTPGSGVTDEPVAMTTFFAVTVSPPTSTVWASTKLARPLSQVTLFFLNRNSIPPVSRLTASSRWPCIAPRSSFGVTSMPILAIAPLRRGVEVLRGVEHRLRGNAADVEAGAAERLAALGAGGLEPELRRADRRDIAAGPGADHQYVEIVVSHGFLGGSRRQRHRHWRVEGNIACGRGVI